MPTVSLESFLKSLPESEQTAIANRFLELQEQMTMSDTTRSLTNVELGYPKLDPAPKPKALVAADLLKDNHPLHAAFKSWTIDKGTELTKRQATKFLAAHPSYRKASPV